MITAIVTLFRGARGDPFRVGIAAAFLALLLHTMLYADFLEDPVTWTLLAIGGALARRARTGTERAIRQPSASPAARRRLSRARARTRAAAVHQEPPRELHRARPAAARRALRRHEIYQPGRFSNPARASCERCAAPT